jgi:4-amino-4-deoxy-L-arabinose transferase-like glycosyltransferase
MAEPRDAAPARAEGGDLGFSAAAFVVALLPRLYVAIAWAREPVWDGHYYDFGARRIAAGLGYSDDLVIGGQAVWHPWCHYPVGYSGFLGLVYRLFGSGPAVAPVANAITGALLVVVVHRLARLATTPARARIAAALAAFSPGLILYAALIMTEPLAALGALSAAFLLARDARAAPARRIWQPGLWRGAILSGVALGLTTLVRPQALLCAPALALVALRPGPAGAPPNPRRAVAAAAVALAVALLVVAPWTARNCRVMDGCAFVSTNGGWNLAIGASPRATGRFDTLRAADGCPVVRGQVDQDRCWMAQGWRWIKDDPGRWLALIPKKLGHTFDHESFPVGYLAEADPVAWPEERRALWRGVLSGTHRGLLVAAALGVVARAGRGRRGATAAQAAALALVAGLALWGVVSDAHPFWPLAVAIPALAAAPLPGRPRTGGVIGYLAFAVASVLLTHAVFFGEDRYHVVVTPALCILAACALRAESGRGAAGTEEPCPARRLEVGGG